MTKQEFIKKYSEHFQILKDKFVNKDSELESDLKSVIQDELEKYSEYIYPDSDPELRDGTIRSYLNSNK